MKKKNPEKIYYIWSTFYQGKVATPTPLFCVQKKKYVKKKIHVFILT